MNELNIIIFSGIHDGLDYFVDRFVEYLEGAEIDYYVVDVNDKYTYMCVEFYTFAKKPGVVMFSFNNLGLLLNDKNGENFWKKNNIPVFDFIQDHPRNFEDSLLEPVCDIHAILLDKDHISFLEKYYPKVKTHIFLPNGGTEVNNSHSMEFGKRSIDVIYMGNCMPVYIFEDYEEFEDGGSGFCNYVVNYLIRNPSLTTETAIENYFIERGIEVTANKLFDLNCKYAGCLEGVVRRHYKLQGIKALDDLGIHVDIYGAGWEDDVYKFSDNISLHGRIGIKELMPIIGNAKISLCFVPWFKKGCSEKNFDSLLNGALCVTDRSEYLEDKYIDGYNIVYFDLNNPQQMAADVKWLLNNPKDAALIAKRGYETAKLNDTWEKRYECIVDHMLSICNL